MAAYPSPGSAPGPAPAPTSPSAPPRLQTTPRIPSHPPSPLPQSSPTLAGVHPPSVPSLDSTFAQQTDQPLSAAHYLASQHVSDVHLYPFLDPTGGTHSYTFPDHLDPALAQFPSFDTSTGHSDSSFLDYATLQSTLDPAALTIDTSLQMEPTMHHHHHHPPHSPTPPHLLQPDQAHSLYAAPAPHRPRNASESLDPSSAAFPHAYGAPDWAAGAAFRTHRRAPSDTSEISSHSHSTHASPYLGNFDAFEQMHHVSPMVPSQHDSALFGDSLAQFSLSDANNGMLFHRMSPGASPRLASNPIPQQQPLPRYTPTNNFGLTTNFGPSHVDASDPYSANASQAPLSSYSNFTPNPPEGQADTMLPPAINIDFVPSQNNPFEQAHDTADALVPPEGMQRKRAKSDPFASSPRPLSPDIRGRGRSPSLQPVVGSSLSPSDVPLPSASRSRSTSATKLKKAARARSKSTSFETFRDHMLDLADPERAIYPTGIDPKRQKHPSTFQCKLCPKRFTRAYNLRSHLRTHTDERPFVCTVCSKAFARQHDRKRHEGLHSGEKKYVCRGPLKTPGSWGCGRRFARADALGRHFRSEAGRVCIKPLLDEELADRQRAWQEEHGMQDHTMQQSHDNVSRLPAALLQMYPEFANMDWNTVSRAKEGVIKDESDHNEGRSSFDASSGGEWDGVSGDEDLRQPAIMDASYAHQQQQQQYEAEQMQRYQQQQQQARYDTGFWVSGGNGNGNGSNDYPSDYDGNP